MERRRLDLLLVEHEPRDGLHGLTARALTVHLGRRDYMSFAPVGTLRAVGYKFGRWVDTPILQRALGAGDSQPPDEPMAKQAR